nr:MAG TPA: hypothetical protein [Caudoviricetes sp.]
MQATLWPEYNHCLITCLRARDLGKHPLVTMYSQIT